MNNVLSILITLFSVSISYAQVILDFEDIEIPVDSFLNDSGAVGSFSSQGISFPNTFTPEFQSWNGWSVSTKTDTLTAGFTNQYSAIAGSGFEESDTYMVSFEFGENKIYMEDGPIQLSGLYINNGTYAYISMRDGDGFTKQFGGESGDDPDFFLLQILGYRNDTITADTVDFYLADYRFNDNNQDYILKEWTYADVSSLGEVDSIGFILSSSDNGQFGMNTPAYFCVDQIIIQEETTTSLHDQQLEYEIDIFPNPVTDRIQISIRDNVEYIANILGLDGRLEDSQKMQNSGIINVEHLMPGMYVIQLQTEDKLIARKFIKN